MDPLSIAMLASSVLKYNSDLKQKSREGVFNSIVTRGGQWSTPEMRQLAAVTPDHGNFWGDMAAGATAAAQNERGIASDKNSSALIAALTGGGGQGLNFQVPSTEDEATYQRAVGRGRAWAGHTP